MLVAFVVDWVPEVLSYGHRLINLLSILGRQALTRGVSMPPTKLIPKSLDPRWISTVVMPPSATGSQPNESESCDEPRNSHSYMWLSTELRGPSNVQPCSHRRHFITEPEHLPKIEPTHIILMIIHLRNVHKGVTWTGDELPTHIAAKRLHSARNLDRRQEVCRVVWKRTHLDCIIHVLLAIEYFMFGFQKSILCLVCWRNGGRPSTCCCDVAFDYRADTDRL